MLGREWYVWRRDTDFPDSPSSGSAIGSVDAYVNRSSKVPSFKTAVAIAAAALFAVTLVAACGSSSHARAAGSPAVSGSTIVIKNFAFSPPDLTVAPGTKVTVRNEDSAAHTLTAAAPHDRVFDTGDLAGGATTTFTAPATPGTYSYICLMHQFMHGTLTVR